MKHLIPINKKAALVDDAIEAGHVDEVFTMGAKTSDIVSYIEEWWASRPDAAR